MGNGRVIEGRFECRETAKRPEPGESFFATDRSSGQEVVIRLLAEKVDDESHQRRFFERIERVVAMNGASIEKVLDAGLIDGSTPYVVTEKTKGNPIEDMVSDGKPLPVLRSVDICRQIVKALSDAARAGCVHGHLSPKTVVVSSGKRGKGADRIKVIGWAPWDLTESRALQDFDTVSPEVILGAGPDTRSDCYALGVILYRMLTGRLPWTATTREAKTLAHLNDRVDVPSVVRGDGEITPAMDNLVLRLLEKNPDKRLGVPDQILVHLESIRSNEQETTVELGDVDVSEQLTPAAAASVPEVESDIDEGISFASGRRIKTTDFSAIKVTELMGALKTPASEPTAQIGTLEPVSVVAKSSEGTTGDTPARPATPDAHKRTGAHPPLLAVVALAGFFLLAAIGVTGWFVLQYQTKKLELMKNVPAETVANVAPAVPVVAPAKPAEAEPAAPVAPAASPASAAAPVPAPVAAPAPAPAPAPVVAEPAPPAPPAANAAAEAKAAPATKAGRATEKAPSRTATKTASKPAEKPAAKPAEKPAAKPVEKPAARGAAKAAVDWDDGLDAGPAPKKAAAEKSSNKKAGDSKNSAPALDWE